MPPVDFFTFLQTSLSSIVSEQPDAHRALVAAMGNLRARLIADGDARIIRFDLPDWTIYAGSGDADLEVAFDRQIILDLIDGRLTMEDAIYQERLRMFGPTEMIERFYSALLIYLEGLIRIPATATMLFTYRRA
jgi:hypothetical protein